MNRSVSTFLLALAGAGILGSIVACTAQGSGAPPFAMAQAGPTEKPGAAVPTAVEVVTLVQGLRDPWGLDFLPGGELLVTEQGGGIKLITPGEWSVTPLEGVPESVSKGQGGMMDVLAHPEFADNRRVYLSYTVEGESGYSTRVSRARLKGLQLVDHEILFTARPYFNEGRHFGSRLLLHEGYLYITVGDRGNRDLAQSLETHNGKVIRLTEGGGIPSDNPFLDTPGALPEIYTYGHRNPQGIALHPYNGSIWTVEHGPQGGDEINVLTAGANYGWPVITHGREYNGKSIGEGTHREGMEQPLVYYSPSVAPGGMDFYSGEKYSGWDASLLLACLKMTRINRLPLKGDGTEGESHMLADLKMRIRDVQVGPDGLVYALAGGSRLIRLEPRP